MSVLEKLLLFLLLCLPLFASSVRADHLDDQLSQCWSCHGREGRSDDGTIPVIWGQNAGYIAKQLSDYRDGSRDNQIMSSMAESIPRAVMLDVGRRIEAFSWPPSPQRAFSHLSSAVQTCVACHGPELRGADTPVGYAPRLAGQNESYLADQMQAFLNGVRSNQPAMAGALRGLDEAARASLAHEIALMP
jgi:cytochrome c553